MAVIYYRTATAWLPGNPFPRSRYLSIAGWQNYLLSVYLQVMDILVVICQIQFKGD
jgi:hypothetical protein